MALPYATATSGKEAMNDLQKTLQAFGASSFGFFEDFAAGTLTVQFAYRERRVTVTASSKGYAKALLGRKSQDERRKSRKGAWTEATAVAQGQIAVYSMLRDWIKGQVTAVETGILSFDAAFLGQILLPDGRTVHERITQTDMLPALAAPQS
jgi:hypothetical protein